MSRDEDRFDMEHDVMHFAMIHDETEAITGDIPSPAGGKPIPGKSKEYEIAHNHGAVYAPDAIKQVLKIADLLEALLFIHEDMLLGNNGLEDISFDIRRRLRPLLMEFPHKNFKLEPTERHFRMLEDFFIAYDTKIHPVNEIE